MAAKTAIQKKQDEIDNLKVVKANLIKANKMMAAQNSENFTKLQDAIGTAALAEDQMVKLRDQFNAAEIEVGILTKENGHYRKREHDEQNEVKAMRARMGRLQNEADEWLEAANNGLDARTAVRVLARELVKLEDEVGSATTGERYEP